MAGANTLITKGMSSNGLCGLFRAGYKVATISVNWRTKNYLVRRQPMRCGTGFPPFCFR